MSISPDMVRNIVEGALLAAGEPVSFERLLTLFDEGEGVGRGELKTALADLEASMEGRGLKLKEVGSGWRIQVREDLAPWISRLWEQRAPRYTRALLETLAVIAYQQPVTRSDIEQVRGVSVSSNIIKTLLERDWIRILGHRDVPGRPALYGTTRAFLDYFNLRALDELPPLAEIRDLDKINQELGFEGYSSEAEPEDGAAAADELAAETTAAPTDALPEDQTEDRTEDVDDDRDDETRHDHQGERPADAR
ncbi:MAG: SMC-Scp complex subunit ScpB [Gammaproteobacteria bacterium]|nr:SMC-Scp complex subunit ScpB [Gammaproteobacteria bacterium]